MPDTNKETITCPHCGHKNSVEIVTTIHHDNEKTLTELFSGRLNRVLCPQCHTGFMVDKALSYQDHEASFIVYYVNVPETEDLRTYEQEIDVLASEVFSQENLARPTVRLTLTLPDFMEKIMLHRLGMDDRLIEYAKHQLFSNLGKDKLDSSAHRLLVDFSNKEKDKLVFIIFDRETSKPISAIHVPQVEFDNLVKEFSENEQLMSELDTLFPSCYVSVDRLFG